MAGEARESAAPGTWKRAWLVVGLAGWAQIGVILVDRATRQGLVEDPSFSPYHLVGYSALVTLGVYVAWAFFRGLRRGDWRHAFPPAYGGLGAGFVLAATWVLLDAVWRSTLGIRYGIEGTISPPRLLLPMILVLVGAGPLREAMAARPTLGAVPGTMRLQWAGVAAAGLVTGALCLTGFNPVREPLNDFTTNLGTDDSEIWTMAADGSGQTRLLLARGDGIDYSLPAWSPDGTRIAYTTWTNKGGAAQNVRSEDQTAAIWTMASDGSDRRLLVDGTPDAAWIPAYSPDGKWIAYTLTLSGPRQFPAAQPEPNGAPGAVGPPSGTAGSSIWIVPLDHGAAPRRLTPEGADAVLGAWSPDGTKLAFAVGPTGATDIHVASVTASGLAEDVTIASSTANDWGPAWSPDGTTVAFVSDRSGNDDIWTVDIAGGDPVRLTSDAGGDWVPAYAPDGSRIAFVSDRTGDPDVWSMAADGSDPRNLSNHPWSFDGQWSVAWSPDGSRLAYAVASFGDPATSGWVRENLAVAEAILFGLALAVAALLIVALGAPFGSFLLAITIVFALSAFATDQWRFLPAAVVAGFIVDVLVRGVRLRQRARVAAMALPALGTLAIGLTIGAGGTLSWSLTLLLGVTVASGMLGLALAETVDRLLLQPVLKPPMAGTTRT